MEKLMKNANSVIIIVDLIDRHIHTYIHTRYRAGLQFCLLSLRSLYNKRSTERKLLETRKGGKSGGVEIYIAVKTAIS